MQSMRITKKSAVFPVPKKYEKVTGYLKVPKDPFEAFTAIVRIDTEDIPQTIEQIKHLGINVRSGTKVIYTVDLTGLLLDDLIKLAKVKSVSINRAL